MVEGSKFRESHVLKLLSWGAKEGGIPRPLVVLCSSLWLSSPVSDKFPKSYSRQICGDANNYNRR
jgi:hypothetical protein